MHVERKRIDVSRVDSKDMDNLMPRSPLELEDILDDSVTESLPSSTSTRPDRRISPKVMGWAQIRLGLAETPDDRLEHHSQTKESIEELDERR